MRLRLIQIDAFADRVFRGNPAAVMPLPSWLPDPVLQDIAEENNLSETAFYVADLPSDAGPPPKAEPPPDAEPPSADTPAYHLRWFTPAVEVDLCGHATLATAGQLFEDVHPEAGRILFWTRSGWLPVSRTDRDGELELDFPAGDLRPVPESDEVSAAAVTALGIDPEFRFQDTDLVYVLRDAAAVRAVVPDFTALARLPVRGAVVTAPSDTDGVDFVSRWFGAGAGAFEDPVTGSAHSQIAPYWAKRLGRPRLTARQLSARGGTLGCEVDGDRVRLRGTWRRYLDGTATIPEPIR
ncbi:PhzF family phenazine biosynthesis protein [Plantactinospora solaniradicis]|uniref:PhzF family phenazine biosynthesis protein n=1 Tax=Plantactinospora solaniradicis TaxID=1723736 RepID=A0ABW1KN47_9ACTN